jgi:hypothetical protein
LPSAAPALAGIPEGGESKVGVAVDTGVEETVAGLLDGVEGVVGGATSFAAALGVDFGVEAGVLVAAVATDLLGGGAGALAEGPLVGGTEGSMVDTG